MRAAGLAAAVWRRRAPAAWLAPRGLSAPSRRQPAGPDRRASDRVLFVCQVLDAAVDCWSSARRGVILGGRAMRPLARAPGSWPRMPRSHAQNLLHPVHLTAHSRLFFQVLVAGGTFVDQAWHQIDSKVRRWPRLAAPPAAPPHSPAARHRQHLPRALLPLWQPADDVASRVFQVRAC